MMEGAAECTPFPADAFASIQGSWTMTLNDSQEEAKVAVTNDGSFSLTDGEEVIMSGILRPAAGQQAQQGWNYSLFEKNGTDAQTLATLRISAGELTMEWRMGNRQVVGKGALIVPPPEESESESSAIVAKVIGLAVIVGVVCLTCIVSVVCVKCSKLRRSSSLSESIAANPRLLGSVKAASKGQLHGVVASQPTSQCDKTLDVDMGQIMLELDVELDVEQGDASPRPVECVKAASKDQRRSPATKALESDNTLDLNMGQEMLKLDVEQGEAGSTTCGDIDQVEAGSIRQKSMFKAFAEFDVDAHVASF